MMTPFRILEISCYALMNYLPFLILTIYTFYNFPRYSKAVTTLFCIAATIIQIATRFWSVFSADGNSMDIVLIRLILYVFLALIAIDAPVGKILFTELIFSNLSTLIMIIASCTDSILFPNGGHVLYCWHKTVIMLVLHLMMTLPFSFFVKRRLRPALEQESLSNEWSFFWLIPAIFYIIWQYQIYGDEKGYVEAITDPSNMLFLIIISFGSYLIYSLVIVLSGQLHKNLELEQEKHFHDIAHLEYRLLEKRIENARRARHDLKHHMVVMKEYMNRNDFEALKAYMNEYVDSSPEQSALHFCSNKVINSLLLHFANIAKEHQVDFQVKLKLNDSIEIPDVDLSVLLGNLLENAVDACMEQTFGERRIWIQGSSSSRTLVFTIDNTCSNKIVKNHKGQFLSTKQKGLGLGIESAKNIVERYHGVFTAEKKEDRFYVSFMLNF